MIAVQSIIDRIKSALDAEGFDRYTFDRDFKPAINYAQDWCTSLFDSFFEENKLSAEYLKDLVYIAVYYTSAYSRIDFETLSDWQDGSQKLWTIIAIYPEPIIVKPIRPGMTVNYLPTNYFSVCCPAWVYVSSNYSAKLQTKEQVNINTRNPFAQGNEIITTPEIKQYAYINFAKYNGRLSEVMIFPELNKQLVAVEYIKYPNTITLVTDNVYYPDSALNLLVEKALEFLSVKQGGGTLKQLTAYDSQNLINLFK
jgi:hypothetical protein